jgi:TonB family protein
MIRKIFFLSLTLVLASVPGFAQSSAKTATQSGTAAVAAAAAVPAVPKDPKDLMLLAAKVNGLSSMGDRSWYVMANFQTFDPDGKPKDKGTFEEWWAGPEKYKISYTSSGFNQVLYHVGGKSLVTGDTGMAPLPELMANQYLLAPLPEETEVQKNDYLEKNIDKNTKSGKVELRCIQEKTKYSPARSNCFEKDAAYLRVESSGGGLLVVFNNIVKADGHYIAKQINVLNSGLAIINVNVTALEFPSHIEDSMFVPPPSAVAAQVFWGDPSVVAGKKIGGDDPPYPANAKIDRIQGTVILSARISKAGTIDDLQIVSGPEALRRSSFNAVKTWKYKPYLLNGEPVEVGTRITVIYTLGQ